MDYKGFLNDENHGIKKKSKFLVLKTFQCIIFLKFSFDGGFSIFILTLL